MKATICDGNGNPTGHIEYTTIGETILRCIGDVILTVTILVVLIPISIIGISTLLSISLLGNPFAH
jgi:hypothetical protein